MPNILATLGGLRMLLPARFRTDIPVVPVVRLSGVIGVSTPLRPGLTLVDRRARARARLRGAQRARGRAARSIRRAARRSQSHLIFRRIRQLAAEKKLPVIAFVEDVGASGGYMLACAADEIICRSVLDRRLDRRGRRLVRLRQADRQARHRAAALHLRRAQGDARSVPAGEAGGREAPQGDPEGHPRAASSRW